MSLPGQFASNILRQGRSLLDLAFEPGSVFSLVSLTSALLIAMAILVLRRPPGRRALRLRVWLRALFPRRMLRSPSTKADLGFFVLNTLAAGALIGWAMLAVTQVGAATLSGLAVALGPSPAVLAPRPAVGIIATIALFLAYELAYWLAHYLSHKLPFLWAFHKPHHTAEVLTPLTNFRVHPIDSLVFGNISALLIGATSGLLAWTFGGTGVGYTVSGNNLVLVIFTFTLIHLQHSHFWIAATGVWGRILVSPAHHQIHHSDNPVHFDRNFGSCLAVWDWMFGTLHIPAARREPLVFGGGEGLQRPHSITGTLITPFVEAARSLRPAARPVIVPAE